MSDPRPSDEGRRPVEPATTEPQVVVPATDVDRPAPVSSDTIITSSHAVSDENSGFRESTRADEQSDSPDNFDTEATPERPAPSRTAPPATFTDALSTDTALEIPAGSTDISFSDRPAEEITASVPEDPQASEAMRFLDALPSDVQDKFHQQFEHGPVTPEALTQFLARDAQLSEPQIRSLLDQLAPDMPEDQREALIKQARNSVRPAPESGTPEEEHAPDSEPVSPEMQQQIMQSIEDEFAPEAQEILRSERAPEVKQKEFEELHARFLDRWGDVGKSILLGGAKTGIVSGLFLFFLIVAGAALIGGKGK